MKNLVLIIVTLLIVFAVWYALKGREWLKTKPWAQSFFAWIEPLEIALYKKSETLLMGRMLWVGGLLVTSYDSVATFATGLDMTPLTNRLLSFVPDDLRGLTVSGIMMAIGLAISRLRKRITAPLEVVAAPSTVSPAAAAVVQAAADATAQAVAVVKNETAQAPL